MPHRPLCGVNHKHAAWSRADVCKGPRITPEHRATATWDGGHRVGHADALCAAADVEVLPARAEVIGRGGLRGRGASARIRSNRRNGL